MKLHDLARVVDEAGHVFHDVAAFPLEVLDHFRKLGSGEMIDDVHHARLGVSIQRGVAGHEFLVQPEARLHMFDALAGDVADLKRRKHRGDLGLHAARQARDVLGDLAELLVMGADLGGVFLEIGDDLRHRL